MFRVMFVCSGNICRSPMAALVFGDLVMRAGLDDRVRVGSAGTGGAFAGCTADPRTIAVLEAAGYPSVHTARQIRPRRLCAWDLLVALDIGHERVLRRLVDEYDGGEVALLRSFDPACPRDVRLGVPDPYRRGFKAFEECLAMVEPACVGLLETVRDRLV